MKEKKLVPKRRFREFANDDTWEQRLIENLGEVVTGSTPPTANESYYSSEGILWVTPTDIENNITNKTERMLTNEGAKVARIVPKNTILVTCIASIGKNTLLGSSGSFNQQINAVIPNKDNDSYFIYTLSNHWSNHMKKMGGGLTFQIVNKTEFSNIETAVPKYDEQKKIGQLFYQLDNLITLHQRKLKKLKATKSAYLNDMFPKDGEKVPKVRFKCFENYDNWRLYNISELFRITRGDVLSASKVSKEKSSKIKYPVYSSQTSNDGLMGYYHSYLYEDAITWTTDGANAGTVSYRKGKFYCTNVSGVLISNSGYANKMVAEVLNKVAWKYVSKVGNPKLMNNVMGEINIILPRKIEEQKKIGDFFYNLDKKIKVEKEKLKKLQSMKKAYLNEMFV